MVQCVNGQTVAPCVVCRDLMSVALYVSALTIFLERGIKKINNNNNNNNE